MSDDKDVKRIKVGEDFYILALSGSSQGGEQMRKQASEAMKRAQAKSRSQEKLERESVD